MLFRSRGKLCIPVDFRIEEDNDFVSSISPIKKTDIKLKINNRGKLPIKYNWEVQMSNWYIEVTDKDDISQGDILLNCPVISASYGDDGIEANLNYSDVIVITQACDLENKKVDMVLLAPLLEAKDENIKKNLKEINKGRYPRYHLINEFNSEDRKSVV